MASLILLLATVCSIAQGQSVFNANIEICCNGTLYKKPLLQDYYYECCGNEPLYQSIKYKVDKFCCGGTILSKEDGLDCCGGIPYDRKISDCHEDNTVVDIPQDDLKAGNTHACGVSSDKIKFYNIKTHLCCEGNIRKRESEFHLCCGKEVHDSSTTACCGGVAIPRELGSVMDCCGQNLYNPNTHICCKNKAFEKYEEPVDTEVNEVRTLRQQSFPSTGRRQYTYEDCCGAELYNRTSQKCCRRSTINAEGLYEELTSVHFSEGGEDQYTMQCCGTDLIDSNTQMCVNDEIHRIGDTITRHCCQKTYKYYVDIWQWLKEDDQSGVEDDEWCFKKGSSIAVYEAGMMETCYENTWSKYNSSAPTCPVNGQVENYDFSRQVCCLQKVVDVPKKVGIDQDSNAQWQCCEAQ